MYPVRSLTFDERRKIAGGLNEKDLDFCQKTQSSCDCVIQICMKQNHILRQTHEILSDGCKGKTSSKMNYLGNVCVIRATFH